LRTLAAGQALATYPRSLWYKVRVLSFRLLFEQSLEWHQPGGQMTTAPLSVITADVAAVGWLCGRKTSIVFSIIVHLFNVIIVCHVINSKIATVCLTVVPMLMVSASCSYGH
jgi:hypothetical protein